MVTLGESKTKLPISIFLNSLVVQQVLLEKEPVHHNTGCYLQSSSVSRHSNRFVMNFQPHYAFSQLSPLLHGQFNVATTAKLESYTNLKTFQLHVVNGLKWSFPHFQRPVRTADVAKQSCPHVSFFLLPFFFFPFKKGVELSSSCAIFMGNKPACE